MNYCKNSINLFNELALITEALSQLFEQFFELTGVNLRVFTETPIRFESGGQRLTLLERVFVGLTETLELKHNAFYDRC